MNKTTRNFPDHSPALHKDDPLGIGVPESCANASQKGTIMSRREIFMSASAAVAITATALATTTILPAVAADKTVDAELLALGREMEAAHAEVVAACASGDDLPDDFAFVDSEVAHKICAVPALTVAGLRIKVGALFLLEHPEKDWDRPDSWEYEDAEEGLVLSLMRDILAMEG